MSKRQLYDLIVALGYVQVDSIQWVERAHHMILHSRNQHYRPPHLHELIESDALLFENYTHDASVIPIEFFPFWKCKFERIRDDLKARVVRWQGAGFLDHCDVLMTRISQHGPVRSRDLVPLSEPRPQEMWQWHDGKAALEYLWRIGQLSIAGRDGFQKVYDLSSRVIPHRHFSGNCSPEALVDWACRQALQRLGFATPGEIAEYWDLVTIPECRQWLSRQDGRTVKEVIVESADGSPPRKLFARRDIGRIIAELPKPPRRVRTLSPFDPVIRNRKRLQWLFNFDYRIEIYVPAAKRKYGYYVFPMLDGDTLFGRIDMRADRKNDRLQVQRFWPEGAEPHSAARQKRLHQELSRQAKLAGVSQVECLADNLV